MKPIILTVLALASSAAAWGSVEFCVNSPEVNPGYECATYTFDSDGCFDLPQADGSFQHPNLRGNTHFVAPSAGLCCNVSSDVDCKGYTFSDLTQGSYMIQDAAISSAKCADVQGHHLHHSAPPS